MIGNEEITLKFIKEKIKEGAKFIVAVEECNDWEGFTREFFIYPVNKNKFKEDLKNIFLNELKNI